MVGTLLRRAASTAIVAAVATVAAPMTTAAWADVTPLAAPTFAPADGDTVAATRPAISATYNTALSHAGTQLVVIDTNDSNRQIACPQVFSTDSTSVGCTPTEDLVDGHVYSTRVQAVNAASASDTRNDSANWTDDIPSIVVASPGDGATVAVVRTLTATYDEDIDGTHSTVKLVNGFGATVPGSVSTAKSSATGACPTSNCVLKFTAGQSLPAGTYTVTYDAFGVTSGVPSSTYNAAAHAHDVMHFTVDKSVPAVAPYSAGPDVDVITQANADKVPFSGWALPGFNVGAAIYDEFCDQNCDFPFSDAEGTGQNDGFGHVVVDNCTDDVAHFADDPKNPTGPRLKECPFTLTVDDSAGCDTGGIGTEFACNPAGGDPTAETKNQWYVYSYASAGQNPGAASPGADPEILRDTTAPAKPDNSAHGYLTNDAPTPGNAQVHVAASDAQETPDHYVVRVNDGYGRHHDWDVDPNSSGNLLTDVTITPDDNIYDGPETVQVGAADQYDNVSSFVSVTADPNKNFKKNVDQLAPADPSGHQDSMVSGNGATVDFATLTTGTTKNGVPTKLTVHFTEPIALTVTDDTVTGAFGSGTPSAHLCLLAPGDVCTTALVGTLSRPADDKTTLVWTAPPDFGGDLPDGVYTVAAFAPADDCVARTDVPGYSCETSGGQEDQVETWPTLASFTIDKAAPVTSSLTVTPSTITPSKVKSVTISGSSDPDTRNIQVSIKSSAGGTTQILNQQIAAPSDPNATSVSWSFFPVDLSQVRDGKLTVSAIGIDDAGNQTAAPGTQTTATLAAHLSTLTEKLSSSKVTYGKLVLISGHLSDQAHKAISKAVITVRERFGNGHFTTARQTKTDGKGNWQMLWAPSRNGTFYAGYAGSTASPLHDAAATHTAKVLVRAAIAFTSPKNGATVGSPVVLKGHVSPNKSGHRVGIYRHTATKNILVGHAKLDSHSSWLFSLRLPAGRTVRLFAQIGKTAGNLGNRSSLLTLKH
jgi:hypothetical protein